MGIGRQASGVRETCEGREFARGRAFGHQAVLRLALVGISQRHAADDDLGLGDAGVLPIAPVLELDKALDSPFLRTNGMITHVPHPQRPDMRVLANPIKINGQRLAQATCSPMGADTEVVLESLKAAAE